MWKIISQDLKITSLYNKYCIWQAKDKQAIEVDIRMNQLGQQMCKPIVIIAWDRDILIHLGEPYIEMSLTVAIVDTILAIKFL